MRRSESLPDVSLGLNNFGNRDEDADLYEYDNCVKERFSYKAVQFREPAIIDADGDLQQLWRALARMRIEDPYTPIAEGLSFDGRRSNS